MMIIILGILLLLFTIYQYNKLKYLLDNNFENIFKLYYLTNIYIIIIYNIYLIYNIYVN